MSGARVHFEDNKYILSTHLAMFLGHAEYSEWPGNEAQLSIKCKALYPDSEGALTPRQ